MASMWYCCGCNFGPLDAELHDSCTNCDQTLCSRCPREESSNTYPSHHAGPRQEMSAYPGALSMSNTVSRKCSTPPLTRVVAGTGLGELHNIRSLSQRIPDTSCQFFQGVAQCSTQTYMYICCKCGDGPKVYNHQPKCVICNHAACGSCQNVK
ncbi:hypothetical protein PDE_09794 [Penicillium oxalicum 114-2]|uniref:Uncharacterized protein n=1 Tax=Penicillium oxalicum (strain 114-2 / CGMCC 5302) TaxID=933388 RepID=S7ZVV4_PENO1|nr:hypothetical protein PDE_09794 [Penicillium oxalicum 114-2]